MYRKKKKTGAVEEVRDPKVSTKEHFVVQGIYSQTWWIEHLASSTVSNNRGEGGRDLLVYSPFSEDTNKENKTLLSSALFYLNLHMLEKEQKNEAYFYTCIITFKVITSNCQQIH